MAENSKIEWTTHTFNPWSGCTKVSAGCANCYAEVNYSVRMRGVKWGPKGNRIVASESMWREPVRWNKFAELVAEHEREPQPRPRVFCASLADVFEDWQGPILDSKGERFMVYKPNGGLLTTAPYMEEPGANCRWLTMQDVRARLFALIDATPNLDWLVLTKRPENVERMMPPVLMHRDADMGPYRNPGMEGVRAINQVRKNVWLGTSVENQQTADERIPHLLRTPAAVRFLSVEPLLGPVDLSDVDGPGIDWVIVGGESGPGARPCNVAWVRSIVEQCRAAGVACFVKQMGARPTSGNGSQSDTIDLTIRNIKDKKGGDMAEWPGDLRIREFPTNRSTT